jgi:hypothetical protein
MEIFRRRAEGLRDVAGAFCPEPLKPKALAPSILLRSAASGARHHRAERALLSNLVKNQFTQ